MYQNFKNTETRTCCLASTSQFAWTRCQSNQPLIVNPTRILSLQSSDRSKFGQRLFQTLHPWLCRTWKCWCSCNAHQHYQCTVQTTTQSRVNQIFQFVDIARIAWLNIFKIPKARWWIWSIKIYDAQQCSGIIRAGHTFSILQKQDFSYIEKTMKKWVTIWLIFITRHMCKPGKTFLHAHTAKQGSLLTHPKQKHKSRIKQIFQFVDCMDCISARF